MLRKLLKALNSAFVSPTLKQMEAYGRYAHTLSAACVIGCAPVIYSPAYAVFDVVKLFVAGVILFLGGALLSRGA